MAMTQAEWYAQKNREQTERVEAAHALRMAQRRASMASDPGGFNPWEKKAVDDYYRQKEDARRFDANDVYRNAELGTREKVAEYGYKGQRDAGSTAAGITAEATKYGADKTLDGIQAQAKSAEEIARAKAEAEKWIAGRNAEVAEGVSKREWGYMGADGNYVPGGRVRQAEAQGESAAKIAEANNATKLEQERVRAQAKERATMLMGKDKIKAALAENMAYSTPEKARQAIEALVGSGMEDEEITEFLEWKKQKAQGGQGGGNPPQPRSQKIDGRYEEIASRSRTATKP